MTDLPIRPAGAAAELAVGRVRLMGSPQSYSAPRPHRLDALTSLRFVAAMMIVIHHSRGTLLPQHAFSGWPLDQGVSFFFVLSGFILTYVYPSLPTKGAILKFWQARFARLWPVHVTALILVLATLGPSLITQQGWLPLFANIAMIQGWIPVKDFFFSYNAASWSISTECGFYLLFPLLIHNLERTWYWKLSCAALLLIALAIACQLAQLPPLDLARSDITAFGILYINPLGRLFEFVLGMSAATLWRRRHKPGSGNVVVWTLLETVAVVACLWAMRDGTYYLAMLILSSPLPTLQMWSAHATACAAFAVLIYCVAGGSGLLSRILSVRPLIVLGEASYAIYLIHQVTIPIYLYKLSAASWLPQWTLYPGYLALLLTLSLAIHYFIETPARRAIRAITFRQNVTV